MDVADPLRPAPSGSWPVPGNVHDLVSGGGWVHATYMHTRTGTYSDSLITRYRAGLELGSSWDRSHFSFGLAAANDALYILDDGAGLVEPWFGDVVPSPASLYLPASERG